MTITIETSNELEAAAFMDAFLKSVGIDEFKNALQKRDDEMSLKNIAAIYCKKHGITMTELTKESKAEEILIHRHTLAFVMHKLKYGPVAIGNILKRDHSTISKNINAVKNHIKNYADWKNRVENALKLY